VRAAAEKGDELGIPVFLDQNKILFYEVEGEPSAPKDQAPAADDNVELTLASVSVKDCNYPWTWALISSNGDVRPCCYAPQTVGNIIDDDLSAIWNNSAMEALRSDLLADRINPVCAGAACKYVQQNMTPP